MYYSRQTLYRALYWGIVVLFVFTMSVIEGANALGFAGLQGMVQRAAAANNTAVTTYKNDNEHTGSKTAETILNTSNVTQSTFGKRVVYPLDGQMYAQPLYLPNITIAGIIHNVVYVATEHDSVYAFDADQTHAGAPLWHTSFLGSGIVVPSTTDVSCTDTKPEIGITGTPVIDRSTGTLYVVAMTKENGTLTYRLHALDIVTGQDKPGSPTRIQATVSGKGAGNVNGKIAFSPLRERQRAALVLANGAIYISWASFCDNSPYHGWIMSYTYDGTLFHQTHVYNDSVNGAQGGIWGAGGAISADASGNIYYVSGNGTFDANTGGVDYGDSYVKLNAQLGILDYFTPFNQQCLAAGDRDLGSGGVLLIPGQNRLIGAGKEGRIYVVNTASMGHYNTVANPCSHLNLTNVDRIVQELPPLTIGGFFSTAAYWKSASGQEYVYFSGRNDTGKAFRLNSNGTLATPASSHTPETFAPSGGNFTVSSDNGAAGTGILWVIDPAHILRAFDATDLSKELYNSAQNSARDAVGSYVKFSVPTVANGEVFVGSGSLNIFGLLPTVPVTPTPTPIPGGYNNIGISNDTAPTASNYDGAGNSYSEQALQSAGIVAGGSVNSGGFSFVWPNVPSGTYDNYQAGGQVLAVTPVSGATHLAFLGSATNGATSGSATITYTDNSTQTFTLGFTDWAASTTSFGNTVVASTPYRNTKTGQQTRTVSLFLASVALQAGKTIQSVTLPTSVGGGQLHVFAFTTQ